MRGDPNEDDEGPLDVKAFLLFLVGISIMAGYHIVLMIIDWWKQ